MLNCFLYKCGTKGQVANGNQWIQSAPAYVIKSSIKQQRNKAVISSTCLPHQICVINPKWLSTGIQCKWNRSLFLRKSLFIFISIVLRFFKTTSAINLINTESLIVPSGLFIKWNKNMNQQLTFMLTCTKKSPQFFF